ncbi:hypothetical protein L3Q82_003319 [Scortum barcoo]|uniref:Uncharacterized protein n=1 Tax=Scortum barcoo TaxID=214431 RepID=A0ACB8VMN9_9TELE|nr:hypothetical protein L3Q82_003319 [Scortum barcoo]
MKQQGQALRDFYGCLNEAIMRLVSIIICYAPVGMMFLIAGKTVEMKNLAQAGGQLGMYTVSVIVGLLIHGLFVLPLLYFLVTRKNPYSIIGGLFQALITALGTSSSITATAASIGAAGIRQAGLVTMVIILTSVGLLPTEDATLIIPVDWFLYRLRTTTTNVLDDALGVGIVEHLSRGELQSQDAEAGIIVPCNDRPVCTPITPVKKIRDEGGPTEWSIRQQVAAALHPPASKALHSLQPGDFVVVKGFKRQHWQAKRWHGLVQVLLTNHTDVKVVEWAACIHASHCKRDGSGPPADGLDLRLPHWPAALEPPQGTVLAPLLFTLYTSDFFCYNSELCHIQKVRTDDTAIVGCIRDDREEEYRRLVRGLRCMVPH